MMIKITHQSRHSSHVIEMRNRWESRRREKRRLRGRLQSSGPPEFAAETPASSPGPFGFLTRFLQILRLHLWHQATGCSLVAPSTLAFRSLSPTTSL